MALEHDVHAVRDGEVARDARGDRPAPRSMLTCRRSRAISPGCGVMMTSTPSRPVSRSGSPANAFERVGVDHQRHVARSTTAWTNAACRRILPEAGPDRDDVGLEVEDAIDGVEIDRPARRFLERLGHVLRRHRRDDRHARPRRRDRDQAGAGPQRAERRQMRGAGLAERAGDDQHAAVVPLVGVGGARRHQLAHRARASAARAAGRRARRSPSPGMPMSAMTMSPRVGVGRRQHQRQLRRRQRHRHRRLDRLADRLVRIGRQTRSADRSRRPGCPRR